MDGMAIILICCTRGPASAVDDWSVDLSFQICTPAATGGSTRRTARFVVLYMPIYARIRHRFHHLHYITEFPKIRP
ncbi:uncharacterized protein EI90DRAFT_3047715 [Cantharellus anzutake]|uniref:uncharacterized protein n=1 Tax=Cantharellus anzutake TaxID=1750568 RepID=UPI0019062F13|nr:uncharacterized protein EI90DRAFT_3047715 [Cantharellus anzutake]KAF8335973.1 hypothetical protein EI90DRAFT_3047715 [Cantharellus anzutake]